MKTTKTCTRNHLIIDTNMVNNFFQTWHRHSSFLPFLHGEWCTRQNRAREGKGQEMYDILAWDENKIAKINCLIVSYLGNVFDLKIMTKKKKPLKSSKKKFFFNLLIFRLRWWSKKTELQLGFFVTPLKTYQKKKTIRFDRDWWSHMKPTRSITTSKTH